MDSGRNLIVGEMGDYHFILDQETGNELFPLNRTVTVEGFRVGDKIEYCGECFPSVRGRTATVMGFTENTMGWPGWMIWTAPHGGPGCHWTPARFAKRDLLKLG